MIDWVVIGLSILIVSLAALRLLFDFDQRAGYKNDPMMRITAALGVILAYVVILFTSW